MMEYVLFKIAMIICISYDVLMIYYIYIIVIHNCMYVGNIVNLLCYYVAIIVCISYVVFCCCRLFFVFFCFFCLFFFVFMCVSAYGDDFN